MIDCKACNKETVHMIYNNKAGAWFCDQCAPHVDQRPIAFGVTHYWADGKGSISAAHLDDIKHRVYVAPEKRVVRDTGRKYI